MNIIDSFLLRDPYEVCEAVRKAMEPRTVQLGPLKIIVVSNVPMPPGILGRLSCGPEPEQNVWLIRIAEQLAMPRIIWVRIPKFCAMTGETDDSVRANMNNGHWPEGIVWKKAPNGRIYIHTRNFNKWVAGQVYAPQARVRSGSASSGRASGVAKGSRSPLRAVISNTSNDSGQP
jgi:hypothetical protein